MTAAETTVAPGLGLTPGRRSIALAVVLLAFFMDLLDTTIVNVGIPAIQADLGASYAAVQWIVAGYALAFAVFLITGGRLGDIYGYKPLFLIGIGGFTAASAICGFAPDTGVLIGARLLQGFFAAMMVPQILSTIQVMYTTAGERRNVTAFYGAAAGIATVGGPIIGALLISGDIFGLGWRSIFLVNIPVGVLAVVLAAIYMPNARAPHRVSVDALGVFLIVAGMLALMFPLIQGRELDWPWWSFGLMALALAMMVAFGFYQRAKERRDASPLVVVSLFRQRSYTAGVIVGGVFFAIVSGYFLIQQLWLQVGLGYTPLKAGLTGIPFSIGISVAAGMGGPILVPRLGRLALSIGAAVMALGLFFTMMSARWFGADVTPWELLPSLFVSGVGMGMIVAPVYSFVLAEVPIRHAGSASGVVNAVGQIGGAIGVALIGVIFFNMLSDRADDAFAEVRPAVEAALAGGGVAEADGAGIAASLQTCVADSIGAGGEGMAPSCGPAGAMLVDATAGVLGADLAAAGLDPAVRGGIVAGYRTCATDTVAAGPGAPEPQSCLEGREQLAALEPLLPPGGAEAIDRATARAGATIGAAMGAAFTAVNRDFGTAFEDTLWWNIGGLVVVFLLTFLLPRRPREDMDLMA